MKNSDIDVIQGTDRLTPILSNNGRKPPQLHAIAGAGRGVADAGLFGASDTTYGDKLTGWRLVLAWALCISSPWALIGWALYWVFA